MGGLFCRGERLCCNGRAGIAEAGHGRHAVYIVGAGSQDCLCGWVVQRLMKRAGDRGLWVAEVALRPGEHTFMYVVDDNEWIAPPLAEGFVMDGFGQTNGDQGGSSDRGGRDDRSGGGGGRDDHGVRPDHSGGGHGGRDH